MRVWHPWRGLERLPRPAWILALVTLVNRAGTMVLPFLVLYLTDDVGLAPDRAGLVLVVYGAGAIVAAPAAGWLSDRIGPLRLMKASLVLSGAVMFVFPFARTFGQIATAAFALALVNEAFRPASLAVIGDAVPAPDRKAAFALNRLAINLGMSIGPALGGFLATVSFLFLFAVDGTTSLVAGVLLAASLPGARIASADTASPAAAPEASPWGALGDPRWLAFLVGALPIAMLFFQPLAAMPLHIVRDLGYSERAFGLFVSINTVVIVLVEVQLNLAMAEWSHRRSLVVGALLGGAGFGALAFAVEPWAIAATVLVWTAGEMILFPAMAAFASDLAPADRRGAYMGVYSSMWSVAFAVGPWLGTVALERTGARALWTGCFALGALSAGVFWIAGREQPER
jgi:predicted MFS family arabinose efflux permease